jgi:hypothetical protein
MYLRLIYILKDCKYFLKVKQLHLTRTVHTNKSKKSVNSQFIFL